MGKYLKKKKKKKPIEEEKLKKKNPCTGSYKIVNLVIYRMKSFLVILRNP